MLPYIIVEVGQFADGNGTPSYQFFERRSNGTYRRSANLPDGESNEPMYYRDAKRRVAEMSKIVARQRISFDAEDELE